MGDALAGTFPDSRVRALFPSGPNSTHAMKPLNTNAKASKMMIAVLIEIRKTGACLTKKSKIHEAKLR